MPNNENNYRVRLEFAAFLRGIPEFRITNCEMAGYVNIAVRQINDNSSVYFSRSSSRLTRHSGLFLMHQLFKELERVHLDPDEFISIGSSVRKYLLLLKQVAIEHGYYMLTPGVTNGIIFILLCCVLIFPDNKTLIYSSLLADLYGLGFWLFSVWSSKRYEQTLGALENKLIEKINFLKSLSFSSSMSSADEYYLGSSLSMLPSYEDVLLENAIRCIDVSPTPIMTVAPHVPSFFYLPVLNNACSDSNVSDNTDLRPKRCYSI